MPLLWFLRNLTFYERGLESEVQGLTEVELVVEGTVTGPVGNIGPMEVFQQVGRYVRSQTGSL